MRRTKKLIYVLLAAVCMILMCSCESGKTLSFGTGNEGGVYYSYGNTYARIVCEDSKKIKLNVKTTAGSAANLRLVQQGFLDIAVAQSDTLLDAYNGSGVFAQVPCEDVRALAGLYTEECQIIVKADSDIHTVSDLYGKRVSIGENESGVIKNAEEIMSVNGINLDMIDEKYLSFTDSAAALKENTIDAFFCTAGAPTTAVAELAENMPIRVLSLDEQTIKRMTNDYFGYTVCTIPAGTYKGQTEDIKTVGVKAVLIASDKLSDDAAAELVKNLFEHNSELWQKADGSDWDLNFAAGGVSIPFHSGAARLYSDNGITVNTDKNNTSGSQPNVVQD